MLPHPKEGSAGSNRGHATALICCYVRPGFTANREAARSMPGRPLFVRDNPVYRLERSRMTTACCPSAAIRSGACNRPNRVVSGPSPNAPPMAKMRRNRSLRPIWRQPIGGRWCSGGRTGNPWKPTAAHAGQERPISLFLGRLSHCRHSSAADTDRAGHSTETPLGISIPPNRLCAGLRACRRSLPRVYTVGGCRQTC